MGLVIVEVSTQLYPSALPKPDEIGNLLMPVCIFATHVEYSSLRMEPQYMILWRNHPVVTRSYKGLRATDRQEKRRILRLSENSTRWIVAFALVYFLPVLTTAQSETAQAVLHMALGRTNAAAVLLDGKDGHLLAVMRPHEAGGAASTPGSTLKPLFLAEALRAGVIRASSVVSCRRNLRIAGRNLACTHPLDENAFDAERALAYSCNSYFANLAKRLSPEQEVNVLRSYGFGSRTGLFSPESPGSVIRPESEDSLQLAVLGLETMSVTPAQLARAYFLLAQRIHETPAVQRGLEESVAYGMAHNAFTSGLAIAGKTGTASDPGQPWTHGWFAGIVSRGQRSMIVVIYAPRGNGADAAQLAHRFFVEWQRAVAR